MSDPTEQFRAAMLAAGLTPPDAIHGDGKLHRFSTSGTRSDTAGWYVLHIDGTPAGSFGCWRRGMSSEWTAQRRERMTPAERANIAQQRAQTEAQRKDEQRQQWAKNARRNEALWNETVPVTDCDPVSLYLRRRGLTGPVPDHLRLHPGLTYWDDGGDRGTWPAMVAPLVRPDGIGLALHRTYLTADGCKAPVPTVKKLTSASGPLAGACIPLHEPQGGVIGIAEGIETAQAAHLASGLPTVAAYSAGNMAAVIWPADLTRLVVFADADLAGAAAAQNLKERALRAGLSVAVMTPTTPGADWCDVLARRDAITVNASEAAA